MIEGNDLVMKNFKECLGKELLFFDGAMGTTLQKMGLKPGELPEIWNIERPEDIKSIHKGYVDAGADIIKTNTFGANRIKMKDNPGLIEEVIVKGVAIAREANPDGFVALDIGPLGKLLAPMGDLSFDGAYDIFAEAVRAGAKTDCDLILIETMTDVYEAKAAVLAAKENSDLPVVITFAFEENQRLLTGATIETTVLMFEALGVDAIGFNCGLGPRQMKPLAEKLAKIASIPVVVNPNAGMPVCVDGVTTFDVNASEFADIQKEIALLGCSIVGGCCGTTKEHIKALCTVLKGTKVQERNVEKLTAVSSATKTAVFGKRPLIVGERINPTGKEDLANAIKDGDIDSIIDEVFEQSYASDIIDVNVGVPGIDEAKMMEKAVFEIQSVCNLPLSIDTADSSAMERAIRIYNGKPLLNSVNGKQESMDTVFPIAKKYGAAVVCMTLDEKGIPASSEGRIEIARKIIAEVEKYGIKKENLVFDTVVMPDFEGDGTAKITLETLDYIKNTMGCSTILGISNISCGFGEREKMNAEFFVSAMEKGLSAGIVDPTSDAVMDAYRDFCDVHSIELDF